jgi:hypothetical protein
LLILDDWYWPQWAMPRFARIIYSLLTKNITGSEFRWPCQRLCINQETRSEIERVFAATLIYADKRLPQYNSCFFNSERDRSGAAQKN